MDISKIFYDWDWEDTFLSLLVSAILLAGTIITAVAFHTKTIDYYYIMSENRSGTCVYSHWTWHVDDKAYCSDDKDKALEFAAKANALLPK